MRIIAGTNRGMRLLSPKGDQTRPITDRVKESLFNVLYSKGKPEGCVAADLFCGTGSMGLEALSRGAKWVTFIDSSRAVIEILNQNIAKAGFLKQSKSVCANILRVGAPPTPEYGLYDLVFCDPPYEMSSNCGPETKVGKLMAMIDTQVKDGAMVVLRTHLRSLVEDSYAGLRVIDKREWGNMKIAFFEKSSGTENDEISPVEKITDLTELTDFDF
ncbi:MAG: 16S rRNA (guanine(966)-N(2))-methyltransferase RsmD [Planctomycetaceae bacterium]|nr:16S rRNA (guanine(966)-N(2))-methyltransferase RsmD [Planctomycetaceae bacterium]